MSLSRTHAQAEGCDKEDMGSASPKASPERPLIVGQSDCAEQKRARPSRLNAKPFGYGGGFKMATAFPGSTSISSSFWSRPAKGSSPGKGRGMCLAKAIPSRSSSVRQSNPTATIGGSVTRIPFEAGALRLSVAGAKLDRRCGLDDRCSSMFHSVNCLISYC